MIKDVERPGRPSDHDHRGKVVTAVVCAAFDAATDAEVLAIREAVRAYGVRLAESPAHRPHLTLSAARLIDDELPRFLEVVAEIATRYDALPIRLTEVGQFARTGVLWLGPERDRALPDLQRDVYKTLKRNGWPSAFAESAPYRWTPHCTLATRVPRPLLRSVRESLLDEATVIDGSVVGLATILVGGRGDVSYAAFGRDSRESS
jgi:2'-5' RNA ligase